MKRKIFLFYVTLIICISFMPSVNLAKYDDIPKSVIKYTEEEGLQIYKELVANDPVGFGFNNEEEVNKVELGEGLRVNYIDTNKLKNSNGKENVKLLHKLSNEWDFIIKLDGKPVSLLTVHKDTNNKFEVKQVGGNPDYLIQALKEVKDEGFILLKEKNISYLVKDNGDVIPALPEERIEAIYGKKNKVISSEILIKNLKVIQDDRNIQDKDSGIMFLEEKSSKFNSYTFIIISSLTIALLGVAFISIFFKKKRKWD